MMRSWFSQTCLVLGLMAGSAFAQAATEEANPSALGVRQQRVARMMQELDRHFLSLAKSLEAAEPERAARLVKAYEESKTLLLEQRMAQIVQVLDGAKLDNAGEQQQQVLEDIRKLLAVLLAESSDSKEQKEEIERLRQWHQQITQLIREEQKQQAESQKLDRKDEALNQLAKQIEAVEELVRRQQDLVRQTERARAAQEAALGELSDKQQTIRQDTQFVAQEIAKAGNTANQAAGQPSNTPASPGQKPLEAAAKSQQGAEQKLQANQAKPAQQDEEQALAELKKALEELKKEQERLQKPPENTFDKLAEQQQQTEKKTDALSQQMSKAAQAAASKPGAAGACSACQKCMGGACQSMQSASSSLKKKSPGPATKEQKKAEEQLQQAKKEVEKRLEELGEKPEDETIVRLESIFGEMLARQKVATAQTKQFDVERQAQAEGELRRGDRITLRRLSQEELALGEMAGQALKLIEEDGTSISFPVVVANLQETLDMVAGLLDQQQTGPFTQSQQIEIEKTLAELLEALEVAKKQSDKSGQCKGGNCKPALLPDTAELKLLRALQLRVNRRTKSYAEVLPAGALDQIRQDEVRRISKLQGEVAGMTRAIIERTRPAAKRLLDQ